MPDIPHTHICSECEDRFECLGINCKISEDDEVFCADCDEELYEEDDEDDDLDDLYDDSVD